MKRGMLKVQMGLLVVLVCSFCFTIETYVSIDSEPFLSSSYDISDVGQGTILSPEKDGKLSISPFILLVLIVFIVHSVYLNRRIRQLLLKDFLLPIKKQSSLFLSPLS